MILLLFVGTALCSLTSIHGIEIESSISPFVLCPVKGQIFHQCQPCPSTCDNLLNLLIACDIPCTPGCGCPAGQVVDTVNNKCVDPKQCPPKCNFPCGAIIDCEALGKKSVALPGQCCPSCVDIDEDACVSHRCPTGSRCMIHQSTGTAFCQPSCDLDNGGCSANQECSLVYPPCIPEALCIPEVKCTPLIGPACANHNCPTGSQCKVYQPTGNTFCEPSCDINNGGCPANQDCSLVPTVCPGPPCPPVVKCTAPIHTVCQVGGKIYHVGETFKQGCSDCICVTTGQALCSINNCDSIGHALNR